MKLVAELLPNGRVRFTRLYYAIFGALVVLIVVALGGQLLAILGAR